MRRDEAIAALRSVEAVARQAGVTSLYLFGSTARDEAEPDSDLDVFVEYDPASGFSGFKLAGLQQRLEGYLGMTVDLTTRGGLHPVLRRTIEEQAIRIF